MLCWTIVPQVHSHFVIYAQICVFCLIPAMIRGARVTILRLRDPLGVECLEYAGVSWVDEGGMIGESYSDFDLGAEISSS